MNNLHHRVKRLERDMRRRHTRPPTDADFRAAERRMRARAYLRETELSTRNEAAAHTYQAWLQGDSEEQERQDEETFRRWSISQARRFPFARVDLGSVETVRDIVKGFVGELGRWPEIPINIAYIVVGEPGKKLIRDLLAIEARGRMP